jgi:hypothetical protein
MSNNWAKKSSKSYFNDNGNDNPFQKYVNNSEVIKRLGEIIHDYSDSQVAEVIKITKGLLEGLLEIPKPEEKHEVRQIEENIKDDTNVDDTNVEEIKKIVPVVQKKKTIKNYYNIPKWFNYNKTRKNTNKKPETQPREDGVIVNNEKDIFYIYNDTKYSMLDSQKLRFQFFNEYTETYYDAHKQLFLKQGELHNKEYFKIILDDIQKYFLSVHNTLSTEGKEKENVDKIIVYFSKFKNKHAYMYLGELICDNTIHKYLMYYLLPLITNTKAIYFAKKIIPESYSTFNEYKKYKTIIRVVFCTLLIEDNIIRYFTYDDIVDIKKEDDIVDITTYFPSPPKEYINYKISNNELITIVQQIIESNNNCEVKYTPIIEIKKDDEPSRKICKITIIKNICNN